jgi:O-antigen/teichoic acid export membrane protein
MLCTLGIRVLNAGLRVLSLGSRFVLLFGMAALLEPFQVGLFGLFSATVSFGVLLVGGDFYTYSQRELLSVSEDQWSFVLQHQLMAIALLYVITLPFLGLLFVWELMPAKVVAWFFIILVIEHLAQEINRLLISMRRPLLASWVLFIRMGAWVWLVLPVLWLYPQVRDLDTVFLAWLIGALMALVAGGMVVRYAVHPWRLWPWDRVWIKKGFRVGVLFLTATICFKALLTVDRYIVEVLTGADLLGVYVLYIGTAMTIMNFVDAAIFSFLYPRLVSAYRKGDGETYRRVRIEMAWTTTAVSLGLAIVIAALAPFVLEWIGRSVYLAHLPLLWVLLGAAVAYTVGMIPHYDLYARGADRSILAAHASSLLVFFCAAWLLAGVLPLQAVAWALVAAFLWMGALKYARLRSIARSGVGAVSAGSTA